MPVNHFSVLISPTYRCNADCEYCYENKTSDVMALEDFETVLIKIVAYLREWEVTELKFYWQGGEIFTMPPEWLLRANDLCREISEGSGIRINNSLQSNLIGYRPHWRRVVSEMFNDNVGSSLDFPNLYRKVAGGAPETFNEIWFRRYHEAREAGIQVGVIAVLNGASLRIGAHEFYSYYVEELGIDSFQLNTPYPGGRLTPAKRNFPLETAPLSSFYTELFDLWMLKGRPEAVNITPFDELVHYFRTRENRLSCVWSESCGNLFIAIGPKGNVGQCECFVASYPEYLFGNILTCHSLDDIMNSPARKQFLERPVRLVETQDCTECKNLALCHGGCAVRAYSTTGSLYSKDPYCESNKTLFRLARNAAMELDGLDSMCPAESPPHCCA